MRIGLSGANGSVERVVEHARAAEAEGFTSLWYPGASAGDPLIPVAHAGRATTTIEVGTSILPTYPCHPMLMAGRATTVANAMERIGFTLGIGPSHQPVIEGVYGMSYAHAGRHTEEYATVLTQLLRGDTVAFEGDDFQVHARGAAPEPGPVPVLIAALAPRLLRVAGAIADGTITWMANARALESLITPSITRAANDAGRDAPRVVVGLPVCVHDDVVEARTVAAEQFAIYGALPNYQRVLAVGGIDAPADAVIVGNEAAVRTQIEALFAAGATDVWANTFLVGDDRAASRERTRALLGDLARS